MQYCWTSYTYTYRVQVGCAHEHVPVACKHVHLEDAPWKGISLGYGWQWACNYEQRCGQGEKTIQNLRKKLREAAGSTFGAASALRRFSSAFLHRASRHRFSI